MASISIKDLIADMGYTLEEMPEIRVKTILKESKYASQMKDSMFSGTTIEGDKDEIEVYVISQLGQKGFIEIGEDAKKSLEDRKKQLVEDRIEAEIAEKELRQEVSKIMITSGFGFEGYRITKYSGYISGDDATMVPLLSSFVGQKQVKELQESVLDAYARIRIQALKELKEAAVGLGCNAVIGLDFDYMTTSLPGNIGGNLPFVLSVTANGTAVRIEKE